MISLKRYAAAVTTAAAVAAMGMAATPATAATAGSKPVTAHHTGVGPANSAACVALTTQLNAQLQVTATALATSNIVAAQVAASAAQATTAQLQVQSCLPSVNVIVATQLTPTLQDLHYTLISADPDVVQAGAKVNVLLGATANIAASL
jgi:hypothetical protein